MMVWLIVGCVFAWIGASIGCGLIVGKGIHGPKVRCLP